MKELTIEEKAKAYDEAIERAKEYHTPDCHTNLRIAMENLFPELKESEDERIRKELICYFEKYPSIVIGPFNTKECIAWLEKQGKKDYDFPLAHEKMETERWKEACKAACNDVNYRSHYGLTETRDDYFVDGVHWADEHPKQKPVNSTEPEPFKINDDTVSKE